MPKRHGRSPATPGREKPLPCLSPRDGPSGAGHSLVPYVVLRFPRRSRRHLPGVVVGVEQVVAPLAAGLLQVVPVQSPDVLVLVAEADPLPLVQLPQGAAPV